MEAVPTGVAVFDRDMRYILASKGWIDDFRIADPNIIGKSHYEVFPDVPQRWKDVHRRCLAGAIERCDEDSFHRADGTVDWVRWEVRPWRDASREIGGIAICSENISARKHAEDALRESESRFRGLVTATSDAIYRMNPDWSEMRQLRGKGFLDDADEPIRDWLMKYIAEEDRPMVLARIAEAIRTRSGFSLEHRVRRADGTLGWTLSRAVPLTDANGEIREWFGGAVDVTERKEAEAALRATLAERDASLSEKNRAEERLQAINAELMEVDRRKDQFLAMLGHELRNPLAAIQLAVTLLKRPAEQPRAGEMIRRQTDHLVRLVDDLLEISRISTGKLTLKKQRTFVMNLVQQAVETCRPLIEDKQLELSVFLPPAQIALEADPARLTQALANLLTNAAKYTPTGGRISLRAARESGDVVFRVKDTGMGIPREMLGKIFEAFIQGDQSLDRSAGGLGLGLALVRKIVELHGGTVAAHSDGPGQGSEFVLAVPTGQSEPAVAAPMALKPGRPADQHRVLVVDDNRDIADGLATLLSGFGHEVHVAYDGPEALEVAARSHPDVVILDIGLPHLDGYEVAQRLRRLPGGAALTLIALSGYGLEKDRRASSEAGFDLHFVKPDDLEKVEEVLASLPPEGAPSAPG